MKKTLEERLAKKTQQIIENVKCPDCGGEIHYILRGANWAAGEPYYSKVETKRIEVVEQTGSISRGYRIHKCKKAKDEK